jgi:succinate dehydrogenase / fumarate reductase, cytochrome b subunit
MMRECASAEFSLFSGALFDREPLCSLQARHRIDGTPGRCERQHSHVNAALAFSSSSIGKKWIVALTGLVLFLFVIGHMLGNLQVFLGAEAINHYGEILRFWPELLWVVRIVLLVSVILHIIFALRLVVENRRARPVQYEFKNNVQSKLSTRLMSVTGTILLVFVVFHLMHFTTHNVRPEFHNYLDSKGRHDVFRMVVEGFSSPVTSFFYIIAMTLLCLHLTHGAWSWLQTLGLRTKKIAGESQQGARIVAALLAAGFIAVPVAVLSGLGKGYVAERQHADQIAKETAAENAAPRLTPNN